MVVDHGRFYRSTTEIINKIADTFSDISTARNYTQVFNNQRLKEEKRPLDFRSNNKEPYNSTITLHELQAATERSTQLLMDVKYS